MIELIIILILFLLVVLAYYFRRKYSQQGGKLKIPTVNSVKESIEKNAQTAKILLYYIAAKRENAVFDATKAYNKCKGFISQATDPKLKISYPAAVSFVVNLGLLLSDANIKNECHKIDETLEIKDTDIENALINLKTQIEERQGINMVSKILDTIINVLQSNRNH